MSTQKSKRSLSHIRFLVSGITLIVYYLLSQGVPSVGNSLDSLRKFIIEVFVLVLLIGFYFFFLFGANGWSRLRGRRQCFVRHQYQS